MMNTFIESCNFYLFAGRYSFEDMMKQVRASKLVSEIFKYHHDILALVTIKDLVIG